MAGVFIVFEGADGAGTTTQSKMLQEWMRKRVIKPVHLEKEPTDSEIGKLIRRILQKELDAVYRAPLVLANLFTADRSLHSFELAEVLSLGDHVICDRYLHSTLVYQGTLIDPSLFSYVSKLQQYAVYPDLTFILDVPEYEATARRELRKGSSEIYDVPAVQRMVIEAYRDRQRYWPEAVLVDGTGTPEEVHARIVGYLEKSELFAHHKNPF